MLAFEKKGPKRLELSWSGFWKNFTAKVDGQTVLTANGQSDIKAGRSATLADGSTLSVRLKTGFGNAGLEVLRDGQPLPGTSTDPATQLKLAGGIVYFLAGLNALIGVIALVFDVAFLKENFGYGPLVMGAIFAVLGYFTNKRSMAALIVAIVLYGLDGVITLGMQFAAAGSGHTPNVGFIFMRVIFIIAMIRGVNAITQLRKEQQPA
ncbi:MAG TPA: hypothetical protein VFF06_20460 [Polyangia bacterium]|nr:hypothetical protein [Polyangia bacterium]